MRRLISPALIAIFILWLLPLGVFIAPAKEKLLCDGQRAVCLCSHASSMAKKSDSGKIAIKASAAPHKESSGSSNHLFLVFQGSVHIDMLRALYFSRQENLYALIIPKSIEHVPKA